MSISTILLLYIVFRFKQYCCDFILQDNWMGVNKGLPSKDGLNALMLHVAYHGIGTAVVALLFVPSLWWLGIVDFALHGGIDKVKAMLNHRMKWMPKDRGFWLALGFDQEVHNFTHLGYMIVMIEAMGGVTLS